MFIPSFFRWLGLVIIVTFLPVVSAIGQDGVAVDAPPPPPPPPPVEMAKEASPLQTLLATFAAQRGESKDLLIYTCKHVSAGAMAMLLEDFLTPGGTVAECRESDTVVIMDETTHLPALRRIVESLDVPLPQILVEARIVEFAMDTQYEKEVNVDFQSFQNLNDIEGLPDDSMTFVKNLTGSFVSTGGNQRNTQGTASWMHYDAAHQNLLSVFLTFLETRGRARILSAPNLLLRRGTEGNIITGEEVPILTQTVTSGSVSTSTTFKSVGIKLRVQPTMVSGNKVRLRVSPEVSNVTRMDDKTGAPVIAVRSATTELDVLDGQMVSIGGLLRSEEREIERRVPFLGSIPLLGHLFRGTEKQTIRSQLVIFLSIRIIDDQALGQVGPSPQAYEEMRAVVEEMGKKLDMPPPSFKHDLEMAQDKPGADDSPGALEPVDAASEAP